MDEIEEKDLKELKEKVLKVKIDCYEYLRHINRMSQPELLHSGYRNMTNAEAMQKHFKDSQSKIEKLLTAHVEKYPD